MANMYKIGTTATTIRNEDGYTIVRYHNTDVVKFNQDEIVLNTGGWRTVTTKARMNQASNQYGLGFRVYQRDWEWFVDYDYLINSTSYGSCKKFEGSTVVIKRH